MMLTWLADAIRAEGIDVVEHAGWMTRSDPRDKYNDASYRPVGLINHHTAGSSILYNYPSTPYWSDTRLQEVCNITIRPDGGVSVLNAGIAYDSGSGSRKVYDAVRNDRPLPSLKGLTSDMNGTLYFIDIEVQHPGDGSPIDPRSYASLIAVNAAICKHMGWNPNYRLIGHREWAPDRKVDPRWNGNSNPMPQIRQDTITSIEEQEEDMPTAKEIAEEVWGYGGKVDSSGNEIAPSTLQNLIRTKANTDQLKVAVGALRDLDPAEIAQAVIELGVGQAVVDALVQELTD